MMKSGNIALYEHLPPTSSSESGPLISRYLRVSVRQLPSRPARRTKTENPNGLYEDGGLRRELRSFKDINGFQGAFLSGDAPLWILATDVGPARFFECPSKPVSGLAESFPGNDDAACLLATSDVSYLPTIWILLRVTEQMPIRELSCPPCRLKLHTHAKCLSQRSLPGVPTPTSSLMRRPRHMSLLLCLRRRSKSLMTRAVQPGHATVSCSLDNPSRTL